MSATTLVPASAHLPAGLAATAEAATALLKARHAPATRRVYARDCQLFAVWCAASGLSPLPADPQAVALFCAAEVARGVHPRTCGRRLAAIRFMHREAGHPNPCDAEIVRSILAGARRTVGGAPRQAAPATANALQAMLSSCDDSLSGLRDRALLVIGFGAALRRSELVGLDVGAVDVVDAGLRVHLGKTKTDQEGAGAVVPILDGPRLRAKETLAAWLAASGIEAGPLFRPIAKGGRLQDARLADRSVAVIVKKRAEAAGLDPTRFSGHSLRAGFLTSAAEAGADMWKMADISRHRRLETLRGYVRSAEQFKQHAGSAFM
ncbi:site-specific integrase [Thauera terpenica]